MRLAKKFLSDQLGLNLLKNCGISFYNNSFEECRIRISLSLLKFFIDECVELDPSDRVVIVNLKSSASAPIDFKLRYTYCLTSLILRRTLRILVEPRGSFVNIPIAFQRRRRTRNR